MNASKFESTSKSSGASSIASFFAKKESKDGEIEKQSDCEQTDKMKTPSNRSPSVNSTDNLESADVTYERDEIDQSIMNELPNDIRGEIQQFLGVSKIPGRAKRTSKGIEKYTVCRNTTDETKSTQAKELSSRKTSDDISEKTKTDLKISVDYGFIRCSKCGQEIAEAKMDEHNDFHFALEVQKQGEITLDNLPAEPPKKRRKGTISNFFVSKGRWWILHG